MQDTNYRSAILSTALGCRGTTMPWKGRSGSCKSVQTQGQTDGRLLASGFAETPRQGRSDLEVFAKRASKDGLDSLCAVSCWIAIGTPQYSD